MGKIMRNTIRLGALALAVGFASGCANVTKEQIDAIQSTANNALSEARAAKSAADSAGRSAEAALTAAKAAQSTADEAMSCCRANTDKIDRMFEKAMTK